MQASTSAGCFLQSFIYFILLLERERRVLGSVACNHPRVCSRRRGWQKGQEVADVQAAACDSVISPPRADVLRCGCSHGAEDGRGLGWVRAAAPSPRTGPVSPQRCLWRGWKSTGVSPWLTPSLWDEMGPTVSPALQIPPNPLPNGPARGSYLEERTLPSERLSQPAESKAAAPERSAARWGERLLRASCVAGSGRMPWCLR